MDDDIHVHAALEVQSKEPTKKVMMIFQEPVNEHCKYDNARIEFEEEEMDNLSRGLSVGSFNFGIGSFGSKHMDVAPTKIIPMDSSYIPLAKKVELIASCSIANQFAIVARSLVTFWSVAIGYYGEHGKKRNYMKIMCSLISF